MASRRALESFAREIQDPEPGPDLHGAVCACVAQVATILKPEYARVLQEVEVERLPVKGYAERHGNQPRQRRREGSLPAPPFPKELTEATVALLTRTVMVWAVRCLPVSNERFGEGSRNPALAANEREKRIQ